MYNTYGWLLWYTIQRCCNPTIIWITLLLSKSPNYTCNCCCMSFYVGGCWQLYSSAVTKEGFHNLSNNWDCGLFCYKQWIGHMLFDRFLGRTTNMYCTIVEYICVKRIFIGRGGWGECIKCMFLFDYTQLLNITPFIVCKFYWSYRYLDGVGYIKYTKAIHYKSQSSS